ncbi:MAG: hypothetical protein KDA41_06275, partial [Planctomycetales bacterium]|nr:hypothetical protein [Planctomycetales bacterium]
CSTCGTPQVQQFQPAPLMQQYQAVPQMLQQQPTPMYGQAPMPQPTTSLAPAPATGQGQQQQQPADQLPTLAPGAQIPFQQQGTMQGTSARAVQEPYRPRFNTPDIRPLPDLDRASGDAPPLLNPDDRTASRTVVPAGAVVAISWQRPVAEAPAVKKLDDSGWRPAR